MRYVDFREIIQEELSHHPDGLTWTEIKEQLDLPYDRPCPSWVHRMEEEIGLIRIKNSGRAYVWKLRP